MQNRTRLPALAYILALAMAAQTAVVKIIPGYTVTYPKGKIGGSSAVGLPGQYVSIPPAKEYYLDYQVRFQGDFEWVKGGKLPGLVGGAHTSGCTKIVPDGWSARFMWKESGNANLYMYEQNRRSGCGDSYSLSETAVFSKNQWVRVTQRVVINTPGQRDGMVEVWIEGAKRLSMPKFELRGNVGADVALVDAVSLQTFYGGSSQSWAPPKDTHADFSEFHVLDSLPSLDKPFPLGLALGLARQGRLGREGVKGRPDSQGWIRQGEVDAAGRNFFRAGNGSGDASDVVRFPYGKHPALPSAP